MKTTRGMHEGPPAPKHPSGVKNFGRKNNGRIMGNPHETTPKVAPKPSKKGGY
jgi:hypothetical protein